MIFASLVSSSSVFSVIAEGEFIEVDGKRLRHGTVGPQDCQTNDYYSTSYVFDSQGTLTDGPERYTGGWENDLMSGEGRNWASDALLALSIHHITRAPPPLSVNKLRQIYFRVRGAISRRICGWKI